MTRRYPAYRDSGVEWLGEVPLGWCVAPLKAIFGIVGGTTPKSDVADYWDGEINWVTPADLSNLPSKFISDTGRKITESGLTSCGTSLVPAGSLILSTRAPIGSLAIAETEVCTNQGCKALVATNRANPLFYFFILLAAKEALNVLGRGSTFLELSGDQLGSFRAPLPPLPEQTAIAAFLDRETAKIDGLVAEQRRLIDLLREKRQAVISHAVTKGLNPAVPLKPSGIDWLGDVPKGWTVGRLGVAAVELQTGPFGSQLHSSSYVSGAIPVINPSNISNGCLVANDENTLDQETTEKLSVHRLLAEDIVFVHRGYEAKHPLHKSTMCKDTGATLVIAKLDRLSRNAAFLLALRDSGVRFVAVDMPEANDLTVGIMALVAQAEREAISRRTKEALAVAKARGVKLGNPMGAASLRRAGKGGVALRAAVSANAEAFAQDLTAVVEDIRVDGHVSLRAIAAELALRGIRTRRGGAWQVSSVKALLRRFAHPV